MKPPTSLVVRLLLGIVSFIPLIGLVTIIAIMTEFPRQLFILLNVSAHFDAVWSVIIFSFGVAFALGFYYLRLVWASDAQESDRQFWVTLFFQFFPIACPLFWYKVIWKRLTVSEATKKA